MVCKEDVLSWFRDLQSHRRLDVMYELLHMCVPFEVRFLGSCVEEIGKHSYQELRGPAIVANDLDKLSKEPALSQGLLEKGVRHRVLIYLSLLSSRNCQCATWLYKALLRSDALETFILKENVKDESLHSELLLLFTMGLYHPAFTFEQKSYIGGMLVVLVQQWDQRERGLHASPRPFSSYPPGLGIQQAQEPCPPLAVPVKMSSPVCPRDVTAHQHQHPVFPTAPINAPDMVHMWSRPGFVGTISGAPEVPPFPLQPVSPISRQGSPDRSCTLSPPRQSFAIRSAQHQQLHPHPETLSPPEISSTSSLPPFNSDFKCTDEDQNNTQEDKPQEFSWLPPAVAPDIKVPNGFRYSHYPKAPQQYLADHMQPLNLDGDSSLHCSSSNSSSNNSVNQSPPRTPASVPSVPHHGPGRGEKMRVNGAPMPPAVPMRPPPPTVPYTTYPLINPAIQPPNRSVFPYSSPQYRPPFSGAIAYNPTENVVYSCQYMQFVFSSHVPPQQQHGNGNCFNCGVPGHTGAECMFQTIEDITEKKTYALDFSLPLPDGDKR